MGIVGTGDPGLQFVNVSIGTGLKFVITIGENWFVHVLFVIRIPTVGRFFSIVIWPLGHRITTFSVDPDLVWMMFSTSDRPRSEMARAMILRSMVFMVSVICFVPGLRVKER